MGNKQKPSSVVILSPSHSFVTGPYTVLIPEMLQWPIVNCEGVVVHSIDTGIYRKALEALTHITPFETMISIGVDQANKRLILVRRTWGEIFINREHVLKFSHDSRVDNRPYCSLAEWPELDSGKPYVTEKEWKVEKMAILEKLAGWSVEEWKHFFYSKIKDKVKELNSKADKREIENTAIRKRASMIEECFVTEK
jgi:hypothetical protein